MTERAPSCDEAVHDRWETQPNYRGEKPRRKKTYLLVFLQDSYTTTRHACERHRRSCKSTCASPCLELSHLSSRTPNELAFDVSGVNFGSTYGRQQVHRFDLGVRMLQHPVRHPALPTGLARVGKSDPTVAMVEFLGVVRTRQLLK